MAYLVLELRENPAAIGEYEAEIIIPPIKVVEPLSVPYSDECQEVQEALVALELAEYPGVIGEVLLYAADKLKMLKEKIGCPLFEGLFTEQIFACYKYALMISQQAQESLHIQLNIKSPTLSNIPWEYMYDDHFIKDFLGLSGFISLSRLAKSKLPFNIKGGNKTKEPLRVLAAICKPLTNRNLYPLFDERAEDDWLNRLAKEQKIALKYLGHPASFSELKHKLRQGDFDILHFLGHGDFNDEGLGVLVFENENKNPGPDFVTGEQLGRAIASQTDLQLVYLNSCQTGKNEGKLFSSVATSLLKAAPYVDSVIAMQFKIADVISSAFAWHFYDSFTINRIVSDAMLEGWRGVFDAENIKKELRVVQWGVPVHYTQHQEPQKIKQTKINSKQASSAPRGIQKAKSFNNKNPLHSLNYS